MKKFLKVLLVLLLIGIIGVEVYFYYFKSDKEVFVKPKENSDKLETKYLADLYSGYTTNGISFEKHKEGNKVYYKTISGLKDKEIEKKINSKIEDKIEQLKGNIDSKHDLVSDVTANFENSLSIAFCSTEMTDDLLDEDDEEISIEDSTCSRYDHPFDSLNIDLTTGNEVTISDIVNSKIALRQELTNVGYEALMKSIGILCSGGPCTNPDPDYSSVEEDLLSLVTKYNNEDLTFFYTPDELILNFKDVSIKSPTGCEPKEKDCKKYSQKGMGDIYINQNHRVSEYTLDIPFIKLLDNLTIYDKFKTKDNIYEKEGEKVSIKFSSPNDYSSPQMIEEEKSLIDYDILHSPEEWSKDTAESIKKGLFKEMKALETKNFNIYDVFGSIDSFEKEDSSYYYVCFDVRHYDMSKDVYEKNRKKIFTEKYDKISEIDGYYYKTYGEGEQRELGYEFLKDYMDRKAFFYYVYDEKGKEVSTEDFLSFKYLNSVIPDSWLKLGNYKSKNALIKDSFLIQNPNYKYPNTLVIYDYDETIELKYKNKTLKLADDDEDAYYSIVEKLYK